MNRRRPSTSANAIFRFLLCPLLYISFAFISGTWFIYLSFYHFWFSWKEDSVGIITIKSKQRAALRLQEETTLRKERHLFENFIRKHGSDNANPLTFIQFRLNKANWSWSGPLCITSIGCFFLKFRRQSAETGRGAIEFATVNVTEEGSTLAVRFQKPPNTPPPYRIENFLSASLTYYQKVGRILINVIATCVFFFKWMYINQCPLLNRRIHQRLKYLDPEMVLIMHGMIWPFLTSL